MDIRTVLGPACTRVIESASSRKRLLESVSETIAGSHPGVDARTLFDQLMNRERLGSTGLGDGVAIPHCRLEGPAQPMGAFIKLDKPLDFDAPDSLPVDLVFVLVVPADAHDTHLKLLAALARVFGDESNRASLRACQSDDELYARMLTLIEST